MLNLVTGPSGCGKTEYLRCTAAEAARQGENVVFIVPEQYSFETERDMLARVSASEALNIDVLSFSRMAERLIESCGRRLNVLDDAGKTMLMSMALNSVAGELTEFRKHTGNSSFVSAMLAVSTQFKRAGVGMQELDELSHKVSRAGLRSKLEDILLILSAYDALLENSFCDPDDDLTVLCNLLEENDLFNGKTVIIDGFRDFTGSELKVLKLIMPQCTQLYVALCTDSRGAEQGLFAPTADTARRLIRLAKEAGVRVASPHEMNTPYRYKNAALKTLQSCFLQEGEPFCEPIGEISLCACDSVSQEAEYAAAMISELVKNEGYRYRDIAVAVRDADMYMGTVQAALARCGIRGYADRRLPVKDQPLTVFIKSALSMAVSGINTEDMLTCIKTGIVLEDELAVSALENYVYIWGIDKDAWLMDFTKDPSGFSGSAKTYDEQLMLINSARRAAAEPICAFINEMKDANNAAKIGGGIYKLLMDLQADKRLADIGKSLAESGHMEESDCCKAVWAYVMHLLDRMVHCAPKTRIAVSEYTELFTLITDSADVGGLPQSVDCVQFGDAERMRMSSPRAVFVLGANFGVFPANVSQDGIINSRDRRELEEAGLDIFENALSAAQKERFLAYTAVTAPSERLFVTYRSADSSGGVLAPSVIVDEIKRVFPILCEARFCDISPVILSQSASAAAEQFAEHYYSGNGISESIEKVLRSNPDTAGMCDAIERRISPSEYKLSKNTASKLYGNNIRLSASRIETFMHCPFSYYCRYGVKAVPRKKAVIDVAQRGILSHKVLEDMVSRFGKDGLYELTDAQMRENIYGILQEYIDENMGGLASADERFKYIIRNLADSMCGVVRHLSQELMQSKFDPADFELVIGSGADGRSIDPLKIDLSGGAAVTVNGVVDRVDVLEQGGKKYIRIVDYKTGSKKFDMYDVLCGFNLQMLIYLFTIVRNGESLYGESYPAGILYMPARGTAYVNGRDLSDSARGKELDKQLRMNGLILKDADVVEAMEEEPSGRYIPATLKKDGTFSDRSSVVSEKGFENLERHICSLLAGMGRALLGGEADVRPTDSSEKSACQYCDYSDVCGNTDGSLNITVQDDRLQDILNRLDNEDIESEVELWQ